MEWSMKKLAIGTFLVLFLALMPVANAVPGFCGWEIPEITRNCSGGSYFQCRTSCQSLMHSDGGWYCHCSSKCDYLGECTQVASTPEDELTFREYVKQEAMRNAKPKPKQIERAD
jgi:hypothetical protein